MADKHAYFQSPGQFTKLLTHLRRTFPSSVTADTVKKLGLAPKNEGYLVNTMRFLGLIDDEGNKSDLAGKVFSQHQDEDFQKEFSQVVKKAYPELFTLHGENAWDLDRSELITFFRQNDQSSASVGGYQASTFACLAALSGHGDLPTPRHAKKERKKQAPAPEKKNAPRAKASKATPAGATATTTGARGTHDVGLTVRIEINLPAEGDQATYDRIFKSIRENLLNG